VTLYFGGPDGVGARRLAISSGVNGGASTFLATDVSTPILLSSLSPKKGPSAALRPGLFHWCTRKLSRRGGRCTRSPPVRDRGNTGGTPLQNRPGTRRAGERSLEDSQTLTTVTMWSSAAKSPGFRV